MLEYVARTRFFKISQTAADWWEVGLSSSTGEVHHRAELERLELSRWALREFEEWCTARDKRLQEQTQRIGMLNSIIHYLNQQRRQNLARPAPIVISPTPVVPPTAPVLPARPRRTHPYARRRGGRNEPPIVISDDI